ncbi:hypothetical protein KBD45_08455 [Candidatus Dojkabacteria bacterium]|nr:hypothetical protein [Candidatus Dojkabacteria bacterium]
MSANFHIYATKSKKMDKQNFSFNCWQTPTSITLYIMGNKNPINAYIDWVKSRNFSYDIIENHLLELDGWIKSVQQDGFDIRWEAW